MSKQIGGKNARPPDGPSPTLRELFDRIERLQRRIAAMAERRAVSPGARKRAPLEESGHDH